MGKIREAQNEASQKQKEISMIVDADNHLAKVGVVGSNPIARSNSLETRKSPF
jgi:hypothetical protein